MPQDDKQIITPLSPSGRYYVPESMPLAYCGACLIVALQISKSLRGSYYEIVDTFRLPDAKDIFSRVELETQGRRSTTLPLHTIQL